MSDIAHRHVTRGSECVCGSDWNWIADACSAVVPVPPLPKVDMLENTREDYEYGDPYFECRKGHAFCSRH
jgi:hypothetical protein